MKKVYLNEIIYSFEKCNDISLLKDEIGDTKLEEYRSNGVSEFYISDKELVSTAEKLLSDFFKLELIDPEDVDHVIFVSDTFENYDIGIDLPSISKLLNKFDMQETTYSKINGAQCANLALAFMTGISHIKSSFYDNILIVSIESKFGKNLSNYIMSPEMSVLSDSGILLWISESNCQLEVEVLDVKMHSDHEQWLINPIEQFQKYSVNKIKLYKKIARWSNKIVDLKSSTIIFNNYFHHILKMFSGVFRVNREQIYSRNISRFGHTEAGDVFINLKDYLEETQVKNQEIVLVSDSPASCFGIALKK